MRTRAWTFALLAALLLAPGCATLHRAELPEISLVDLKVADMTLFETTAEFTVRITNGNPEPLVLEGGAVRIYVGGVKVGKGLINDRLELPALSSDTVTLPIYISHLALATRLRTVLESRKLPYRVEGVLWREPTLGLRRKIRTVHEGLLDFEPPPAAEAGGSGSAAPRG